jgi:hypothetical protein
VEGRLQQLMGSDADGGYFSAEIGEESDGAIAGLDDNVFSGLRQFFLPPEWM